MNETKEKLSPGDEAIKTLAQLKEQFDCSYADASGMLLAFQLALTNMTLSNIGDTLTDIYGILDREFVEGLIAQRVCIWTQKDKTTGYYESSCGRTQCIMRINQDEYNYCPHCGGRIREKAETAVT